MASSWSVVKTNLLIEREHAKIYLAADMECPGRVIVKSKEANLAKSLKMEEFVYDDLWFDSPNVLTHYGHYTSYEDDKEIYNVVFEYATEGSMESLMKSGKLIVKGLENINVVDQIRVYSKMILKGLNSMHESGYVHSNLDPTNILAFLPDMDDEDMESRHCYTLKISDFKLSKKVGERDGKYGSKKMMHWSTWFRGNPRYMSPESVLYDDYEPPMDIWAFGCIVAEMASAVMTGGLPVRDHKMLAARRVLLGVAPEIPKNMCFWGVDFLYKCFDKRPEYRWTAKMLLKHPFITGGVGGRLGYLMVSCDDDNIVLKADVEKEELEAEDDYEVIDCDDTDNDDDEYEGDNDGDDDDDGSST